jgi:NAD(P)-dependent dehydrogenase (short-subunit alcohol dehydrogenase family)
MWLDNTTPGSITQKLSKESSKTGKIPSALVIKSLGLFVVSNPSAAETIKDIAQGSFYIRYNADKLGGISSLNKRQREFILNWEAESFRKNLVSGTSSQPLSNRIAVVTGAASGLGKAIALGLARAGAYVGLADIDTNAAEKTALQIKEELPAAEVITLNCNVTNEKSVEESFEAVLNEWGGLDILVNAAGVAPAFPLVDMPLDKWRLALEINLTGYFLMAKYAAKIMLEQDFGGNIVNISSKSGVQASKNNGAYNATKAGELHLARGWAMELGENSIRVNSVCPGNVFEGSKIWNPTYIKECGKKYGIKPEEVIPYYINKTNLKREIKGQDIADTVIYLCSDKARTVTGQTLVADSGQVPVR